MDLKHIFCIGMVWLGISISPVIAQDEAKLNPKGELQLLNNIEPAYQSALSKFALYENTLYFISENPSSLSAYSLKEGNQIFLISSMDLAPMK